MRPQGVVIHHSLTKDSSSKSWDAICRYHTETMGWAPPCGYHFGIEDINGVLTVLPGRPLDHPGAHTKDFNHSIGICLVGNYDVEVPNKERLELLANVTLDCLAQYPWLTPSNVYPHNHFAPYKSCPGALFPWAEFIDGLWKKWRDT